MRTSFAILALFCLIALSGCASRSSMAALQQRLGKLENGLIEAKVNAEKMGNDLHDLELRIDYLEREALVRGVVVPYRNANPPENELAPLPEPSALASNQPGGQPNPSSPPAQATATTGQQTPTLATLPVQTKPADSPPLNGAQPPSSTPSSLPSPAAEQTMATVVQAQAQNQAQAQTLAVQSPGQTRNTSVAPGPTTAEQRAYEAALQFYRIGRFLESEAAFQAFLEVYPRSSLVPNALYWKGETYYARGLYADSIFAFKDVQTRFPQNQKTPDSLLKTAMAYQHLNDAANAALHLAVLYEDWPRSEARHRAERMGLRP